MKTPGFYIAMAKSHRACARDARQLAREYPKDAERLQADEYRNWNAAFHLITLARMARRYRENRDAIAAE
jgi:hypothetical protein